jgi:hypothetical protein
MEVYFPPDVQARLAERAARQSRKLEETVQDVVPVISRKKTASLKP